MIVDLFAGPGGWDEALKSLGRRDVIGVELDTDAAATAEAAGHPRIVADIRTIDPQRKSARSGANHGLPPPFTRPGQPDPFDKAAPRYIIRVRTPEAPGLNGVGSHIPNSPRPRSLLGIRLTLPTLGRKKGGNP